MATAIVPYVAPLAARAIASTAALSTPTNLHRAATAIQAAWRTSQLFRNVRQVNWLGDVAKKIHFPKMGRSPYRTRSRSRMSKTPRRRPTASSRKSAQAKRAYIRKKRYTSPPAPPQARKIGNARNRSAVLYRNTVDLPTTEVQSRTLFRYPLTKIPKAKVAGDIDNPHVRLRNLCFIKGFRICMQFENLRQEQLMLLNYAVISPKGDNTPPDNTKFFRSRKNQERSIDFNFEDLDSNDFHCCPINTDRYVILTHKRLRLGQTGATNPPRYRTIDRYVKVNRQLRYEDPPEGSTVENPDPLNNPIYLCVWCDFLLVKEGQPGINSVLRRNINVKTYFSNPGTNL